MKKVKYLKLPVEKVQGNDIQVTARFEKMDRVLILDIFVYEFHKARYLLDTIDGEHAAYMYQSGVWHTWSVSTAIGFDNPLYVYIGKISREAQFFTAEDLNTAYRALNCAEKESWRKSKQGAVWSRILKMESAWNENRREAEREREVQRYKTMVQSVPELPEDFESWAQGLIAPEEYALKSETKGKAVCTACGSEFDQAALRTNGHLAKVNETGKCPACGRELVVKIRSKYVEKESMVSILQDIDDKKSVARFIDIGFSWSEKGRKVFRSDSVWIFLLKDDKKFACRLLYNVHRKSEWQPYGSFWKANPSNRRVQAGYMYPVGIEEALEGTEYRSTARLIRTLADGKACVNYNRILAAYMSTDTLNMMEYLHKGRFGRLLRQSAERIGYYEGQYLYGPLNKAGNTIEKVFRIEDRQLINRIRSLNGGEKYVDWMQMSDETGEKIPQETLAWLVENELCRSELKDFAGRMSLTKIMNYVKKQQAGGYTGRTARGVLEQWRDYLDMCRTEKKNLQDDMVFRPRELKRRHDEITAEINKRKMIEEMKRSKKRAKEEAERMREKFPGAEEILREMKTRLEYRNADYMIIVPERLVDITTEGAALHHCVGTSDRYFERIRNHETYICFLRKASEPDVPYYTIEVEPGGTVRQHRGYLDEEPEIELVKPFIREWQRELKRRLTEEDRQRAKNSAVLRQKNIDELKAKNNKRVLDGLMEDLMEAEVV